MNRKYSEDIDKVRNNDFILNVNFVPQTKASYIASLTSITVFNCANIIAQGFSRVL